MLIVTFWLHLVDRGIFSHIHPSQQVQLHRMARHPLRGGNRPTPPHRHRLHPPPRQHHCHHRSAIVVGPGVGADTLLRGPGRELLVRHGGLRFRVGPVLWVGRRPASHPGRVHSQRVGGARLLRRELSGRVQPPPVDTARGRVRAG